MPRPAFKMITSGAGTNGSPLSQAGVYQSAVPEPQMRGKKVSAVPLLWLWQEKFGGMRRMSLAGTNQTPIKAFQSATWQCGLGRSQGNS